MVRTRFSLKSRPPAPRGGYHLGSMKVLQSAVNYIYIDVAPVLLVNLVTSMYQDGDLQSILN
jgi:hypothetical protein